MSETTSGRPLNHIDKMVYALDYKPEELLAYSGEKTGNPKPKEGSLHGTTYTVMKREKRNAQRIAETFSVMDAIKDSTYPGALLLVNGKLLDNTPTELVTDRNPITISCDMPGIISAGSAVKNPTYSEVTSATNKIIEGWLTNGKGYDIRANFSLQKEMIYNETQMETSFGLNIKYLQNEIGVDFKLAKEGKKQYLLAQWRQIFYTVSMDKPKYPSDMIAESVECSELTTKGVNNSNPPAYVSNVSYGRLFYMKLETTSQSSSVEAAFNAAISKSGITISTETRNKYKDIYENTSFTFLALGGGTDPLSGMLKAGGDFEKVNKIIAESCKFAKSNPGYPLMYTVNFLKDNSIAKINMATEYVVTSYETYNEGKLEYDHQGWYNAEFYFYWDRIIDFDDKGNPRYRHESWSGNGKVRALGAKGIVNLDGSCRNVRIKIHTHTINKDILNTRAMPLVPKRYVKTTGTAFSARYHMTPGEFD